MKVVESIPLYDGFVGEEPAKSGGEGRGLGRWRHVYPSQAEHGVRTREGTTA